VISSQIGKDCSLAEDRDIKGSAKLQYMGGAATNERVKFLIIVSFDR
jgi:hypothetical protein